MKTITFDENEWQLVPVEPTPEIIDAIVYEAGRQESKWRYDGASFYRAMLAAAPQAEPVEVLGKTCIDGGTCHHACDTRCFRRECCTHFSDYEGPWAYPKDGDAQQVNTAQPALTVWEGAMPESNGKSNFTAVLMRKGADLFDGIAGGITLARSEYPDRVRYEADCARWLIGELEGEPCVIDYDSDKHSGYVEPERAQQAPARQVSEGARKVFICRDCEAVYADSPVSSCDCNDRADFAEGRIVMLAAPQAEQFCDGHCTWLDHHPDCEIGKDEQPGGDS